MTLKDIKLTEDQQSELQEKLQGWKLQETKRIEEELTDKYEQMEADLKEEYEGLVEEIKGDMKKVYTKRFVKALKEMHEQIHTQVMVENLNSPEVKALEEVKASVYPFISESTVKRHKDEFTKLAEMFQESQEELSLLKGAIKKAQLISSLTPDVRKVVDKLIGEGTETEIVEKFATIQKALKEQVETKKETKKEEEKNIIDEDINLDDDSDEIVINKTVEDDDDDISEEVDTAFEEQLQEQLRLAGVKKK